jgi:hypothetical protein
MKPTKPYSSKNAQSLLSDTGHPLNNFAGTPIAPLSFHRFTDMSIRNDRIVY